MARFGSPGLISMIQPCTTDVLNKLHCICINYNVHTCDRESAISDEVNTSETIGKATLVSYGQCGLEESVTKCYWTLILIHLEPLLSKHVKDLRVVYSVNLNV